MNQCVLIGRLVRDSEMRTTTSGKNVTNFTIAVNRNYKNEKGEYDADFINCIAYNKTAEIINKYTKKGSQIAIEGRIQTRSYEANTKRYVTEVLVNSVTLLNKKEDNLESMSNHEVIQKAMNVESDPFAEFADEIEIREEDLPF